MGERDEIIITINCHNNCQTAIGKFTTQQVGGDISDKREYRLRTTRVPVTKLK